MIAPAPRGACPSLSAPMQTGDGLLARLTPADGEVSAAQLAAVARAAAAYGNGALEVTARGSLQIRGLTETSAAEFAETIAELGIAVHPGIEVRCGALTGIDAEEIADPRPLAEAIRRGAAELAGRFRFAPKLAVTVDGGGRLGLGAIVADIRLEAVRGGDGAVWLVSVGGSGGTARLIGQGNAASAIEAVLAILRLLCETGATARGRDIDEAKLTPIAARLDREKSRQPTPSGLPVGRFVLRGGRVARGLALSFGQAHSDALVAIAGALPGETRFRFAPGRGLIAIDLGERDEQALLRTAERHDLITSSDDPRLSIVACAGAPACASAHLATNPLARALAADAVFAASKTLFHVSGCAKQCARPSGPAVALVGGPEGYELVSQGATPAPALRATLARLAAAQGLRPRRKTA